MIVIGLTGSIGMGKSTVTHQFAKLGAKICSADAIAHRLMAKGGAAVKAIGAAFPGVVAQGAVDRKKLGGIVFPDKAKLQTLEQILHPLVIAEENRFIRNARCKGARLAVIDIPLLFETDADERFDMTVMATAPFFLQKQRVMKRPNMTEAKFAAILKSQMPDRDKKKRADFVVQTGLGRHHSFARCAMLVSHLKECGL